MSICRQTRRRASANCERKKKLIADHLRRTVYYGDIVDWIEFRMPIARMQTKARTPENQPRLMAVTRGRKAM
jgi:hypothetical protein